MFDWEDQELANIIWGEANEADDHIVPYTEDIENKPLAEITDHGKEFKGEAENGKAIEHKIHITKSSSDGSTKKSLSTTEAFTDQRPDSSSLTASENDQGGIAKKAEEGGLENSQVQNNDKELSEIVDNTWDNIGSFDDLDQILSNDDLVGHSGLGSAHELWSSRDVISDAEKSPSLGLDSTDWELGGLGSTTGHFDINSDYLQDESQLFAPSYSEPESASYTQRSFCASLSEVEDTIGTSTYSLNEKVKSKLHLTAERIAIPKKSPDKSWSKNKTRQWHKAYKTNEGRLSHEAYRSWPKPAAHIQHFDSPCALAILQNCTPVILNQQRLPFESGSVPYHNVSNAYAAHYDAYGNQSHLPSPEGYAGELDPLSKSTEITSRPLKMTPQEKIEKLRRRQQIRAMFAIQKQQQQLSHKVSSADFSTPLQSPQEDQITNIERISVPVDENLGGPSCDADSPGKHNGSKTIYMEVDGHGVEETVEETVLYQLKDIVDQLDSTTRLCIRDSLFRLARSAMQRHDASNMGSTNRSRTCGLDASEEEMSSLDRYVGVSSMETETNHIDRTVAHLLFHQPKVSGKVLAIQEPSTFKKVSVEQKNDLSGLPLRILNRSVEKERNLSPKGSNYDHPFVDHH